MIVTLAGGIGGAKLAFGPSQIVQAEELTEIGYTGDDIELFGLRIYRLGLKGDAFACLAGADPSPLRDVVQTRMKPVRCAGHRVPEYWC